ncbi:MAG: phosphoribosylformylglycinamidine cyclo-ligase [candidate division Zixibacteria bacterium]|nr:phosphoribosylformylglycinamidine cyclo-ligase [candidate division Zixibacteria bacterium]
MKKKLTYKNSGVDISAGDRATAKIKSLARSTFTPHVLKDIGSFGGFFSFRRGEYKSPVLVSSVDSVGTKLKVAFMMGKHDTVGEDLVNHCVNDILVHGAKPLFFLDYIGTGKLLPDVIEQIVKGLSAACRKVGCSLIGGETAELPEFYKKGEYDLAGCIVGVVEKKKIVDGSSIRSGDQIIGLESNGLHTNGYSLARKVLFSRARLGVNDHPKELKTTVGKELLKVHQCYAPSIFPLLEKFKIRGIAHITGGGIKGNLRRILPKNCDAKILTDSWEIPPIFKLLQRLGDIENEEMFKVFNMGIGLVLVVSKRETNRVFKRLSSLKETAYLIGEITSGKGEVELLEL